MIPQRKKEKCAIVGTADSWKLAPFNSPEWEIWGVNNLYILLNTLEQKTNGDRWFEIHQVTFDGSNFFRRGDQVFRGKKVVEYMKELASLNIPVFMHKHWDLIPLSVEYPFDEILEMFPRKYFTNTISWELALAIAMGFKEVGCWGVDMSVGCLPPETKVLTADLRWVKSGDLKVGDQLVGFDEESNSGGNITRRFRKNVVTKCPEIERPCQVIYFEDGSTIIASDKHGWLTHGENKNRWKRTEELVTRHHRVGRPSKILRLFDTWKEETSWDAGYLAGTFDGEGCFLQGPRNDHIGSHFCSLAFSQKQNRMRETALKILEKYGFNWGASKQNKGDTYQHSIKGGKPEIARFLGQFRPRRLMEKFDASVLGEIQSKRNVGVMKTESIGIQKVIGLETSSKTYIAEGFASHNSEYIHQRPSVEYFLGICEGKGIPLHIPSEADLLKTLFLYGKEEKRQGLFEKKIKNTLDGMQVRHNQARAVMEQKRDEVNQYVGALSGIKEMSKIWANFDTDPKLLGVESTGGK